MKTKIFLPFLLLNIFVYAEKPLVKWVNSFGGTYDDFSQSVTTDVSGNYLFDKMEPGQYKVEFVKPSGYSFTSKDTARIRP